MKTTTKIELHTVQQQVQTNGAYSPLHWLLEAGYLPYSHYEDWRYGRRTHLDGAFTLSDEQVEALLAEAEVHSLGLKLREQEQSFFAWNTHSGSQLLRLSLRPVLARALSQRWLRAEDMPQLDLFMDNGAVEAENALIDAIAQRRWDEAELQYGRLCEQAANNHRLTQFETLVLYGKYISTTDDISKQEAQEELTALGEEIAPLARELLRHQAKDYLAAAWQRLAKNLPSGSFDAQHPSFHVSYALAQLPDWPKVIEVIEATPEFNRYEALVARLAEAYWHQQEELALLLWCYISTLENGEEILDQVTKPRFKQAWDQFWELDLPLSLFCAWFLLQQPGILHHIKDMPLEMPQDAAFAAATMLLSAKSQGASDIEGRKALQQASPELLRDYLERSGQG